MTPLALSSCLHITANSFSLWWAYETDVKICIREKLWCYTSCKKWEWVLLPVWNPVVHDASYISTWRVWLSILWLDARWEKGEERSEQEFFTWPKTKKHWIFNLCLKHESVCPSWLTIKTAEEAKLYSYKSSLSIYMHKWFAFYPSTMHSNFLICIVIFSSSICNYTHIFLCIWSFHVCTQLEAEGLTLWRLAAENLSCQFTSLVRWLNGNGWVDDTSTLLRCKAETLENSYNPIRRHRQVSTGFVCSACQLCVRKIIVYSGFTLTRRGNNRSDGTGHSVWHRLYIFAKGWCARFQEQEAEKIPENRS